MVLHKFSHICISILESTRLACNRWSQLTINGTKVSSTGFIYLSYHDTSNIPNITNPTINLSLAFQTKCDNMFSDPESDHIFSHFLGTYLVHILFLLVCDNYTLTLKMGRCRSILSIDSRLNEIDLGTNIISPPKFRTRIQNQIQNTTWRSI